MGDDFLLLFIICNAIKSLMFRSVYPFNTPGAFVPHSAINLSRTKEEESPGSQSLDLSVSEPGVSGVTGANVSTVSSGPGLVTLVTAHDNNIYDQD